MVEEIVKGLKSDFDTFKTAALEQIKAARSGSVEDAKKEMDLAVARVEKLISDQEKSITQRVDEIEIKLKKQGDQPEGSLSFAGELVKSLKDFDIEQNLGKKSIKISTKAVGNMTTANNLTGSPVIGYDGTPKLVPAQKLNFRDLVRTVNNTTGTWAVYRETGAEGSISAQSAQGASKPQKDYDFTQILLSEETIAGYTRFAKQMARNLPWLEANLPVMLMRDFYKVENLTFYADLVANSTASTATETEEIEKLIVDIGELEATDYAANGIVMNPRDWANIAITKPSDYSLPAVVAFINGVLVVNGVPVYKASWMPEDKYFVGDWSFIDRVQGEALSIGFYEQDSDNVQRNLITARIECSELLAIHRTEAFIFGDFGNLT